ncbi:hypothetical protein ACERII_14530 [Evansella sp. AB-rgal1]|uniref:hypothetical protein n=1 Tax=Evansella sp. AB-rgal1 TaxID=3242696 RepID=UPI00359E6DD6
MDRKVYVLLTDTGTIFTKTIKQYTRAPYNHSSIALDSELLELYSFGRRNPKNPLYGGFVKEDVLQGTYKLYPQTTCAVYEINVSERQIAKMRRMINLFEKNKSRMLYNIFGVIGIALKEPLEPWGSYFCSQFVAELLERSGVKLWDKIPALVTPDDFRKSDKTKLIYEGLLLEYPAVRKRKIDDDFGCT